MAYHNHIDTGMRDGDYRLTLCGHRDLLGRIAADPDRATCPACSAKHYAPLIPANVKLERWDERKETGTKHPNHRSVYRLLVDGVHRGYVACLNGWGAGWAVMECHNDPQGLQRPSGQPEPMGGGSIHRDRVFVSKEHATCVAAAYIAGLAPDAHDFRPARTAEEWVAQEAEWRRRQAQRDLETKRERMEGHKADQAQRTAELEVAQARLQTLRGINLEAPAAVAALAWAVQQAQEEVEELQKGIEHHATRAAALAKELGQ